MKLIQMNKYQPDIGSEQRQAISYERFALS